MTAISPNEAQDTTNLTQENVQIVTTKPRISDLVVITGHIHQIREWSECLDELYIFETMGTVVVIYDSYLMNSRTSPFNETVIVVKDNFRMGPTYNIFYPVNGRPLPHLYVGCTIRIVGKLVNKNSMRAMKITCPTLAEINNFDRITHKCYHKAIKYIQDTTDQ